MTALSCYNSSNISPGSDIATLLTSSCIIVSYLSVLLSFFEMAGSSKVLAVMVGSNSSLEILRARLFKVD